MQLTTNESRLSVIFRLHYNIMAYNKQHMIKAFPPRRGILNIIDGIYDSSRRKNTTKNEKMSKSIH